MTWYGVLKVVHVLAVVAWVGGGVALSTVMARLAMAHNGAGLAGMIPHAMKYGHTMGAAGSMVVLVTGIAMVIVGGIGFRPLWVSLGFAGLVLHFVLGFTLMRKRNGRLAAIVAEPSSDDDRLAKAGRAVRASIVTYLVIMATVIAVMILKPTL